MERLSNLFKVVEREFKPRKSGSIVHAFNHIHSTDIILLISTYYLLLHDKLPQNLVAYGSRHLFSHSFCGQESTCC